jgi:hypothetical protein
MSDLHQTPRNAGRVDVSRRFFRPTFLPLRTRRRRVPSVEECAGIVLQQHAPARKGGVIVDEKLLYSKAECAKMVNLSLRRIDQAIAAGELEVQRIGRRVLVSLPLMKRFCGLSK